MKNIILLLLLTFALSSSAQFRFDYIITNIEPAEYIVTYSLKYQLDSLSDFHSQSDMYLFLGENTSKFLSSEMYSSDTVMRQISNVAEFQEFAADRHRPFPRVLYRILKNYPKGKIIHIEHVIPSTFKCKEELNQFNWQLTGDTTTIEGYKVQKATCDFGGRSWVAWFTSEISYSDGPYKFNGLPGLILNIHDTRNHYVFEFIAIEKPNYNLMIDIEEFDFVEATKQSLFRAKDDFRNDIVSRAKEAGLANEIQQRLLKTMSRRNNPLELKRD
ncbi:MAG: GLPGLI family protein [Bacteroidota bacterium]|nr:GLPGLI family protein [Bacteroidota bacterium]